MTIKVTIKIQFGNTRYFPADEESRVFCKAFKQTTYTEDQLKALQGLGVEISAKRETRPEDGLKFLDKDGV